MSNPLLHSDNLKIRKQLCLIGRFEFIDSLCGSGDLKTVFLCGVDLCG
jgi:hypothetical protein